MTCVSVMKKTLAFAQTVLLHFQAPTARPASDTPRFQLDR